MDDAFFSWLAGFYEGEGTAGFSWSSKAPERKYILIAITQSHQGILQLIQSEAGGKICSNKIVSLSGRGLPSWRIYWNGKQARELANKIRPFMRHSRKIEQLERALRLSRT